MRAFLNLHPVPPLQSWINVAAHWVEEGYCNDAAILLDIAARYYPSSPIRTACDRILPVPCQMRGRPLTWAIPAQMHPAVFSLRDRCQPLQLDDNIGLFAGNHIMICHPGKSEFSSVPVCSQPSERIACTGAGGFILFSRYSDSRLNFIWPFEPYPRAFLQMPGNVHQICGSLNDGTIFLTCEPEIPVFSDRCVLCQIDFDLIRDYLILHPDEVVDIGAIQAVKSFQILSNIEQSLLGDTCAAGDFYMTCGGGIQNREVRFIYSDGSWTIKFSHESAVIRIIPTASGPVSLDRSGQAFLWSGTKIVDDYKFDFDLLPPSLDLEDPHVDISMDWKHRRLYLTQTPENVEMHLSSVLNHSYGYCLDVNGLSDRQFVKKVYPMKTTTLVMLSDGHYYFWNDAMDCIEPIWQLSHALAVREDWLSVFNTPQSPSMEEDPRIRMISYS